MTAYYNEFDPKAAAWLRELIREGLIAPGEVDERSIAEVRPADLVGFTQCHFFAGIGGWSYALRLANWPDDRPVWTGSCPCQPYSAAGKQKGGADDRHLWPDFHRLIRECRPERVFGEQVTGAIGHGWLDLVCADLEAEGYAVGSCVLGAHSVGAPHLRQRLYWVADAARSARMRAIGRDDAGPDVRGSGSVAGGGESGGLGNAPGGGRAGRNGASEQEQGSGPGCKVGGLALPDGGDTGTEGLQRGGEHGQREEDGRTGFWSDLAWLSCRDGKARPTQPGIFPLAPGLPGRVALLRGAGNSIVPQVAAAFIRAYCEVRAA